MARWYYRPGHPKANERGFVAEADMGYEPPKEAQHAPILAGRFYENVKSPIDGSDIGSRARHREHMKAHNVTVTSDYTNTWKEAARERERILAGEHDRKERREQVGRAMYEKFKS